MSPRETGAPETERLARLVAVSRRIASRADLHEVLRFLLESAIALTGAERGFFLFRRDGAISCEAATPGPPRGSGPVPSELSRSVLSHVLEKGEGILSTDLAADERFRARLSVRRLGLRSVMAVPFPSRGGGTGVIYLDSRVSRTLFRSEDLELLEALVAQAALALDHRSLAAAASLGSTGSAASLGSSGGAAASPGSSAAAWRDRTIPGRERTIPGRDRTLPDRDRIPGHERHDPTARQPCATILGGSPAILRVLELIERVGPADLPVLVIGESGTGKELVARAIHEVSPRHTGPFLAENCAAIPETLLESELFGSVRGAFTGAERDRDGLFRAADGGTLFLDEIGEMPLPFQARLLRALQEGEVRPVGAPRSFRVNVRVIAAMNREPQTAVASGKLRLDLYYRLAGLTIEVPPLRDRREDIPVLASHFLSRSARSRGSPPRSLSPDALVRLSEYDWPGNVRELENEIERAVILARGEGIGPYDLSPRLGDPGSVGPAPASARCGERTMIEAALIGAGGSLSAAARSIGWSRQKLYRRMAHLGVPRTYGKAGPRRE